MIGAGVVAGTVATLIQLLLWLIFADDFPAILFRDARLTAALALGESVLQPSASFDAGIMLVAVLLHFTLSIAYAALFAQLVAGVDSGYSALLAGAGFGVVLYIVNLYGFTAIFPWFAAARGWIALSAHVVFGATAISVYRCLTIGPVRSRPGGH